MPDVLTPSQRHKAMKHIRGKDTSIEVALRKELWKRGYRYRKNYKRVPGSPDIAIVKYKIAIFCDSEFFHGKDWDKLKQKLEKGTNSNYWVKKISDNIERDVKIDIELMHLGWTVLHFWGNEIKKNPDACINEIENAIIEAKVSMSS